MIKEQVRHLQVSEVVVEDFWLPKVNGALGKGKVKGIKQTQNQAPFQHVVSSF